MMEISTSTLDRAYLVWNLVKNRIQHFSSDTLVVLGTYQNGREQGFSLNLPLVNGYICWSECRNSDQIVVYTSNFDPCQSITDEMYENKKFFDDEFEASRFIVDYVKGKI